MPLAQASPPTDPIARTLAVLALLISAFTLAWNVYSWAASGRRARLRADYNPRTGMLYLVVFNTGRLPVSVEELGLRILLGSFWYRAGMFFDVYESPQGGDRDVPWHPSLPLELPPGSSRGLKVHLGQFYPMAEQQDRDLRHEYSARPFIVTGTGRSIFDRRRGRLTLDIRFQERRDQLIDNPIKGIE
jgi:hypothetical protein